MKIKKPNHFCKVLLFTNNINGSIHLEYFNSELKPNEHFIIGFNYMYTKRITTYVTGAESLRKTKTICEPFNFPKCKNL